MKTLAGRYNLLTADLLAHLAEVDARGIYRERTCSSLYTYCVYELRLSEDEAQRRTKAARTAREFPVLFEMLAEGAIHLTGLLRLAPYLTREDHGELLARARFRTKREIEHLVSEIAPRPDVPARIEPLGPRRVANLWQAYTASLRGAVRELAPGVSAGDAPPVIIDESTEAFASNLNEAADGVAIDGGENHQSVDREPAPARMNAAPVIGSKPLVPQRYRVEFTASARYVDLLEEARDLLQHRVPDRDVTRVHELAMEAFVDLLRKRRRAEGRGSRRAAAVASSPQRVNDVRTVGSALERANQVADRSAPESPERVAGTGDVSAPERIKRYVPAGVRRAVWQRDEGALHV